MRLALLFAFILFAACAAVAARKTECPYEIDDRRQRLDRAVSIAQ